MCVCVCVCVCVRVCVCVCVCERERERERERELNVQFVGEIEYLTQSLLPCWDVKQPTNKQQTLTMPSCPSKRENVSERYLSLVTLCVKKRPRPRGRDELFVVRD